MKRLSVILLFVLAAYFGFGQATPVAIQRIADATTVFGINIPVGTKIYDVANKKTYRVILPVPSSDNITTALAGTPKIELEGGGTITNVTGGHGITATPNGTAIHVTANTGIEQDSLAKMSETASSGEWAKFDANGLVGRTKAETQGDLDIRIYDVYDLELTVDSITAHGTSFNRVTLPHTPIAGTIQVQVNGATLKPTTQYTIVETLKVRFSFPMYKYDQVSVSYAYQP